MRRPCLFCVSTDIGDVLKNPQWRFPISLFSWGHIRKKHPFENWQIYFSKPRKIKCCNVWPGLISVFNISNKTTLKWERYQNNYFIIISWKPKLNARWQKILTQHILGESWFFPLPCWVQGKVNHTDNMKISPRSQQ